MLKKFFASLCLVLVLFSVSLVPCFANDVFTSEDVTVNTDETLCTVELWSYLVGNVGEFQAPTHTWTVMATEYTTNGTALPITPILRNLSSFHIEGDITLYWRIAPFLYGSNGVSSIDTVNTDKLGMLPSVWYGSGYNGVSSSTNETYQATDVQRLAIGNANYGANTCRAYRATIPAKTPVGAWTENFSINYPGTSNTANAVWNTKNSSGDTLMFTIDMFQVVHSTDSAVLNVIDEILTNCEQMNINLNNIISALDQIILQLQALNADTDTIVDSLKTLKVLSNNQYVQLQNISSSVDAIYYFLTQEMKSESDKLSAEAGTVAGAIDNSSQAEEYYQVSMKGSYDSLHIDEFTFGNIGGAMEFVGAIFSDIWNAFGDYTMIFIYPLVLGISCLVIGRLPKSGGGNSSRNAEHKGGEGGA